ncbi:AMP-binding protein [Veillonella criceti]|uniref:Triostin synthetase I n=1 Tax=Veillonella criceti TaxID=103891 RepID=A0A380NGC9_9FIRM|nr:AMP-binding protein [Veillonella criceti]SUP39656.1 Triostin synthetase I [Veillonella criceti]
MDELLQRLAIYSKQQGDKAAVIIDDVVYTYRDLWQSIHKVEMVNIRQSNTDNVQSVITDNITDTITGHIEVVCAETLMPSTMVIQTKQIWLQLTQWLQCLVEGRRPILCHPDLEPSRVALLEQTYLKGQTIPQGADFGVLSSGTTGLPKVLWRSLRSWTDFFSAQNQIFKVDEATVLFWQGSLSFTGNLNSLLSVLYEGGTAVTSQHMSPRTWMRLSEAWQVTHWYLLPTKLRLLVGVLQHPLQALRLIFTGSQTLDHKLLKQLQCTQPQIEFILYYGASELNYITYCTAAEWLAEPNTVGYPFPGVTVTLDDTGLIYVDTPFGIEEIELPYTVGDEGAWSETGRLCFKGRRSAMINRGGYKVSIPYLESTLLSIEGVVDGAVIGVPDELRGEQPIAFLVPDGERPLPDIVADMAMRFTSKDRPKSIVWLKHLPLTACSKVDTKQLRSIYETSLSKHDNNI